MNHHTNSFCAAAVPPGKPAHKSGGVESFPTSPLTHFAEQAASLQMPSNGERHEEVHSDLLHVNHRRRPHQELNSPHGMPRGGKNLGMTGGESAALQFHSAGAMTAAGQEGEGNGAHTPPRIPEPISEMISTQSARSGGLHVEGEPDLPAFLDRRGHG